MTDYGQFSDEQLIAACRDGEDSAWDALIHRYERLVYTIPSRYGLTSTEIEDVFQSVWLSLVRNLDNLREPDRVSAWLVTTARRECWERRRGADYERTVSTNLDLILAETENEDASPEELVVAYREHQNLRLAIKRLEERCRYLLNLLYYEASAPSYAEVAERLRIPIGSIGPMRARCLKKLRAIITRLNDGN